MKTSWKIWAIIGMVALISMASVGIAYANNGSVIPDYSNSQGLCVFSWVKCNDNGSTVAHATATINNTKDTITFKVNNVYPNYHPSISFGLVNQNCTPGVISNIKKNCPEYFTLTLNGISLNQPIGAGQEADGVLDIAFSNDAPNSTMGQTYNMSVTIVVTQSIQQNPNKTQTILGSLPNPSSYGQPVTFSAAVVSTGFKGIPTGSVKFMEGTTILAAGTLDKLGLTSFTISNLSVGSHSINAVYGGDSNFIGNTSNVVVQKVRSKTVCSWPVKPGPCAFGQLSTFKIRIEWQGSGTPTGVVTFYDGLNNIGVGKWSGGTAVLNCFLSSGSHTITAQYSGDDNYDGSTSDGVNQIVNKVNSSTSLTSLTNSANSKNTMMAFTATVTPSNATGTVTFKDGNATLGIGNLNYGLATFSTKLSTGIHSITAVYGGDTNFNGSTSKTVNLVINK
jgi:Bacterial Ig-like domain (group 3)